MTTLRRSLVMIIAIFLLFSPSAHAVCSNNEDGQPGQDGEMEYFTATDELKYCDNTNWIDMVDLNAYTANPVNFDNTNDYLVRGGDLTGNSDSKLVTGSVWFRTSAAGNAEYLYDNTSNRFRISKDSLDRFEIRGYNSSGTLILRILASNTFADGEWHHALFSVDLSDTAKRHIYIDDAPDMTVATYTDDTIDFTVANHWVGAIENASNVFDGDIADIWLDFGTYIDLSVEANRRKFISSRGTPVDLGSDGSTPTGGVPEIFLSGDTATWHTNDGGGGGFTENGALTDGTGPVNLSTTGLIGHWKLDETAGTMAIDSTGNGYAGTMVNMDGATNTLTGVIDTALDFNGSNESITLTASNTLFPNDNSWTVSSWFKADVISAGQDDDRIISPKRDAANASAFMMAVGSNNKIKFVHHDGASFTYSDVYTISTGTWYHYAVSYDGTTYKAYVNGSEELTAVDTFSGFGTGNTHIGGSHSLTSLFDGQIDDLRLYGRVLSADEIYILAHCTAPGVWYYNQNEDVMQFCDNVNSPVDMAAPAGGSGGCAAPVPNEGNLAYDTDRYKYCDGNGNLDIGK